MKKLLTFLLCLTMLMSSVCAYAALPEQMLKIPLNYSSDMTFTASLENAGEIIDFILSLEEDGMEDSGIVDLRTLLGSIFDISGKATVKGDISGDYRKMQLYVSGEATYNVNLNRNIDMTVTPRGGIWVDIDLSDTENPLMDIIFLTPLNSKYYEINVFELIPEEEKAQISSLLSLIFTPQFMEGFAQNSMSVLEKYAKIETKGSECTVTLDNDSAIAMYAELFSGFDDMFGAFMDEIIPDEADVDIYEDMPDMSGIKILGEDGIRMKYTLGRGNIEQEICDIDIDFNISDIYALITGLEWEYENELKIDFNMTADAKFYDHGRTSVEFPVLTDENSINVSDMQSMYDGGYEYTEEYPAEWFYYNPTNIPVIGSVVYVPLRETMYEVYGDTAVITNDNGVITAVCDHYDRDITLSLAEGSTKAYLDGVEYDIGGVTVIDGVEYVDIELFDTVMGWYINYASYNVLTGEYALSGSIYEAVYEESTVSYPRFYAYAESEYLPFIEGQVYLPLRIMLEEAYGDSLTLDYNDGKITAYSEYFPGFSTLVLNVGDSKVYADSRVFDTTACFTENGTTYVHPEIFTELFGWELEYLDKDVLNGIYSFEYSTEKYTEVTSQW